MIQIRKYLLGTYLATSTTLGEDTGDDKDPQGSPHLIINLLNGVGAHMLITNDSVI